MAEYSDLLDDILYDVCSLLHETDFHALRAFSLVDKRSRMAATTFLFRNIGFQDKLKRGMATWEGVEAMLDNLLRNNHILRSVRRFRFNSSIQDHDKWPIPMPFFDLLRALPGLKELHLLLPTRYLEQVRKALLDSFPAKAGGHQGTQDNCLSSITSLALQTPAWLSLLPAFPRLSRLDIPMSDSLDSDFTALALANAHPNLTTLHCQAAATTEVVKAIAVAFPNIVDLGLFGPITNRWRMNTPGDSILVHLPSFVLLTRLRYLSLPTASQLGLGFHPPWCGNAYMEPGVQERVNKERVDALMKLARGIEEHILQPKYGRADSLLTEVSIGRNWGGGESLKRQADGTLKFINAT